MFKLFLLSSLVFSFIASWGTSSELVLPAGTELMIESTSPINSAELEAGASVKFVLSADVVSSVGTILKGATVFGRVVEVNKYAEKTDVSKVVVMFDYLQNGEDFYALNAVILDFGATTQGLALSDSATFDGGTVMTRKGSDIQIASGSVFKIKVAKDCVKEGDPV